MTARAGRLGERVRALLKRDEATGFAARQRVQDHSIVAELRALTCEPMTETRVSALVSAARTEFEARKAALQTGPDAPVLEQLYKVTGGPDPRSFETAEAYSAAIATRLEVGQ